MRLVTMVVVVVCECVKYLIAYTHPYSYNKHALGRRFYVIPNTSDVGSRKNSALARLDQMRCRR